MRSGPRIPATTVELALRLSDAGLPDRDNAEVFGIAVKTIRRWRRVYQREGRQRGDGRPSSGPPCPRCSGGQMPFDEEAYAHLLGWYLGDGSLARRQRGGYVLEIDTDNSYPGLIGEIEQSMLRVKPNGAIPRRFRAGDSHKDSLEALALPVSAARTGKEAHAADHT